MKKLIISILFILCLSFQASALGPMMLLSGGGSTACDQVQLPTIDAAQGGDYDCASASVSKWRATQFVYDGTTGKQICAIDLWLEFYGTNSHTYYVAIYSDDGSDDPDVALGTSDSQDLSALGNQQGEEIVSWTFSTPTSALTNGTKYWVVFYSTTYDAAAFAEWFWTTTAGEKIVDWNGDGLDAWTNSSTTVSCKYKLYSQ